ncbi:FtsX-like permease family protein [Xylophilus rhododendri]|uniref:FtsX-like permease family protein n=1 Tax=Xylophilus rhododendri TaxID=2697032 RepID=A0A857J0T0_9BURK|nr:ABC transporter permease [Xylophilus rhododendri]QHI97326.1 FtsX-like permease family protein [Xylophilus rhododendri]
MQAGARELFMVFSWQEIRRHPARQLVAVMAVMLGVALAFAVHLVNASALDEFAQAARSLDGRPDLELRAVRETFSDQGLARISALPGVAVAVPVLEATVNAQAADARRPIALRLLGTDALSVARTAPALLPQTLPGADRLDLFAGDAVFLNAAALRALGLDGQARAGAALRLQAGLSRHELRLAGTVAAGGAPLAVMDIAAAQAVLGLGGQLSRIELRLSPGADAATTAKALQALPDAAGAAVAAPEDSSSRIGNLSRAYRVNLAVLALIALFTGAYLVFSMTALSVAKRAPQFALLGVLGLTPRGRRALVLAEAGLLGAIGSGLGLLLGGTLAALALRLLGGDLGGGYFGGGTPRLQLEPAAALVYGLLGIAASLVGAWWPARTADRLPPVHTLKGLGAGADAPPRPAIALLLLIGGGLLALAPPIAGIPLAAYASVALILVGGIAALPWLVGLLLDRLEPLAQNQVLALLGVERARRMRGTAAVAVGGVVASLALAVALTVMVASFRGSVAQWLDSVLPADLVLRLAAPGNASDAAAFDAGLAGAASALPGIARVQAARLQRLQLDPARPAVLLVARPIDSTPGGAAQVLPLRDTPLAPPPGQIAIYVSEAMEQLYGAHPGTLFPALDRAFPETPPGRFFVAGVWRDYARQFGAIAIDRDAYRRLSGDDRANELALWLAPGADIAAVRPALAALVRQRSGGAEPEIASSAELRGTALRIFDRSFAVTYWLQAVAVGIGLAGVAASFGAQVLARRKEFGLLAHLGLTRRQILAVVAVEGAAWTAIGAVAGVALGLAVAAVLVHVVNPQSFHWTMDLRIPAWRLGLLALAVVAAGTVAARLAGSAAASRDAVLAVKEDW